MLLLWLALSAVALALWVACGAIVRLRADLETCRTRNAETAVMAAEAHILATQAHTLTGSIARYVISPLGNKPS